MTPRYLSDPSSKYRRSLKAATPRPDLLMVLRNCMLERGGVMVLRNCMHERGGVPQGSEGWTSDCLSCAEYR